MCIKYKKLWLGDFFVVLLCVQDNIYDSNLTSCICGDWIVVIVTEHDMYDIVCVSWINDGVDCFSLFVWAVWIILIVAAYYANRITEYVYYSLLIYVCSEWIDVIGCLPVCVCHYLSAYRHTCCDCKTARNIMVCILFLSQFFSGCGMVYVFLYKCG